MYWPHPLPPGSGLDEHALSNEPDATQRIKTGRKDYHHKCHKSTEKGCKSRVLRAVLHHLTRRKPGPTDHWQPLAQRTRPNEGNQCHFQGLIIRQMRNGGSSVGMGKRTRRFPRRARGPLLNRKRIQKVKWWSPRPLPGDAGTAFALGTLPRAGAISREISRFALWS